MPMSSELRERLVRLGLPVRDAPPPPLFSGEPVDLVLRLEYPMRMAIPAIRRLRAAGLTMLAAKTALDRLCETEFAVCTINEGADIPALAADLAEMNIFVHRRRPSEPGLIAEVRARHKLSQREFAEVLGIEIDTLQNWEQGRNKPDAAALNLVRAFDKAPHLVTAAALERVA
jgi:DNA-binding transcriptional regulator YiaG